MRYEKGSKWFWLWRVGIALAALCLLACGRKPAGGDEGDSSATQASAAEVTVTRVVRASISSALTVTGTVAALPNQDVRVSALVAGRIVSMAVAEGDHVEQGQELARIDDRPFQDPLRQAEAAVEQAKANLENARLNLTRNETLFQRGVAARKELEDARTQVSVYEAASHQAEAALALARLQVARTEVRSPLSGIVVKRFASVGEQVDGTAAQPLFEVANLGVAELFANVPAVYLGKIRVGQNVEITSDSFPGRKFPGRVVAISPAVDPATDVGLVRIRISNRGGLLRLGMFLSAQLPLHTDANALVVPTQAVYRDENGQPQVYRVQGEDAEAVPVKVGIETPDRIELLSGVKEGDTVILSGGYGLGDHAKVKVKA